MVHNRKLFLLTLIALLLIAVACTAQESEIGEAAQSTDNEANSGKLVIYSGRSDSLVQPIIDQFAEASGIDIEVRYGSTSEMAGLLLEEGENSPADIFYAQDPGGIGAVADAGLFAPIPQETLDKVPPRFAADDGSWVGISGRARTVVYNTDEISDPATQLPSDLMGFTDPVWNNRIGWAFGLTHTAIDTGLRVDYDHILPFIKAIHRANFDTVPKLAINAVVSYHISHFQNILLQYADGF